MKKLRLRLNRETIVRLQQPTLLRGALGAATDANSCWGTCEEQGGGTGCYPPP